MRRNLQFLDLAGHDPVEARKRDTRIRSCFSFTIPNALEDEEKKRSQTRDLRICNEIAGRMHAKGFEVSKVGPSKPWGAGFTIGLDRFKVIVMLDAKRLPDVVKCEVLTWTRTPRWRQISSQMIAGEWLRTCEAMEKVLRKDLEVGSLLWQTEDELADQSESTVRSGHG